MSPITELNKAVHVAGPPAPFIDAVGFTDIGAGRSLNDDVFVVANLDRAAQLQSSSLPIADGMKWFESRQGKVLVVADGISGSPAACLAATLAVRKVTEYVVSELSWVGEMREEESLRAAFQEALESCQDEIRSATGEKLAGTSITVVYLNWPNLFVASVGDTRAYLIRANTTEQITRDDTLARELIDRNGGELSDFAPRMHNIVTNAVGGGSDELTVECHRRELRLGDNIVLCTDGVTGHLSDLEIASLVRDGPVAETASRKLVAAAIEAGCSDNATAVVARIEPGTIASARANPRRSL